MTDKIEMPDVLNEQFINSLGQLYILKYGCDDRWWWPLIVIDVQTGCLIFDTYGLPEPSHIRDVKMFKDDNGNIYDPDSFYFSIKGVN